MGQNHEVASPPVPVLDVGGSHVSAALVDVSAGTLVGRAHRRDIDGAASSAEILDALVGAAAAVAAPQRATWGVAMPDPFDYAQGIALFDGVGKFESMRGMDLRDALTRRLPGPAAGVVFLNDADAFVLGEWAYGAAAGHRRCLGLTLGTGVGTGWLVDGQIVSSGPGIPRDGRAHRLEIAGAPLEETVSSRAIRRAYLSASGGVADVREIAAAARRGEIAARGVLEHAMRALGGALGPCLRDFASDVVVVGGSMSASWDLFGPWFREGLAGDVAPPPIVVAADQHHAPLLGAARFARDGVR
ncbi:MAG: ROK family protein [Pseudonocardiales bacterium]|nr:ROK family protein [Actinomycetota bacterium]